MADRARVRVASLQRATIQSLLKSAPLPHPASFSLASDLEEISRLSPSSSVDSSGLTSTTLAPSLLRPVITPRQLLASHTLKHTFRNPHIGALAKTALDLRESEGVVERALGRCFAAMEWDGRPLNQESEIESNQNRERKRKKRKPNGDTDDEEDEERGEEDGEENLRDGNQEINGNGEEIVQVDGPRKEGAEDEEMKPLKEGHDIPSNIGGISNNSENKMDLDDRTEFQQPNNGMNGGQQNQDQHHQPPIDHESSDIMSLSNGSSNPAFSRLEELFITPGGLPVSTIDPDQSQNSNDNNPPETSTTLLSVGNQRAIVRAALECLHELSSDSREYVERLEEVRNRLASVRRERSETWSALRNWSLDREEFRLGIGRERLGNGNNSVAVGDVGGKSGNDGGKNEKKKGTARTNSLAAKRR